MSWLLKGPGFPFSPQGQAGVYKTAQHYPAWQRTRRRQNKGHSETCESKFTGLLLHSSLGFLPLSFIGEPWIPDLHPGTLIAVGVARLTA